MILYICGTEIIVLRFKTHTTRCLHLSQFCEDWTCNKYLDWICPQQTAGQVAYVQQSDLERGWQMQLMRDPPAFEEWVWYALQWQEADGPLECQMSWAQGAVHTEGVRSAQFNWGGVAGRYLEWRTHSLLGLLISQSTPEWEYVSEHAISGHEQNTYHAANF